MRRVRLPGPVPLPRSFLRAARSCAAAALLVLSASPSFPAAEAPPAAPGKPISRTSESSAKNLVLITVEGLRTDVLSCYGKGRGKPSPEIDKLASEGWLFERALTSSVSTLPALATLHTGRTPFQNGVWDDDYRNRLPESETTLAEMLRKKGYRTAAYLGSSRMALGRGFDQGFDVFRDGYLPPASGEWRHFTRPSLLVVKEATQWLGGVREEPFFLWVHLFDPAMPGRAGTYPQPHASALSLYEERTAGLDIEVGKLLAAMRSRQDYSRTAVVLTAVNGMGLDDHGERRAGLFLYESTLRVPLIIKTSKRTPAAPKRVKDLSGLLDVFPSIQNMLGLPLAAGLPGRDLFAPAGNPAYLATALMGREVFGWAESQVIAQGNWRLILSASEELYDLASDPEQKKNLIRTSPAEARRLKDLARTLEGGGKVPPAHFLAGPPSPGLVQKLKGSSLAPLTMEAARKRPLPDPRSFTDSLPLLEELRFFTEAMGYLAMARYQSQLLKADPEGLFTLVGTAHLMLDSEQEDVKAARTKTIHLAQRLYPLEPEVYHLLGHESLSQKRYEDAERYLRIALELGPRYPGEIRYDLACSLALRGDRTGALSELKASVRQGYRDAGHIQSDTDLDVLRKEASFQRFLKEEFPSAKTP